MTEIFPDSRLAAVQAAPVFLDREATLEKALSLIELAAANGAVFIGFPECFMAGFPEWFNYHLPASEMARELGRRMFESALEVNSREVIALGDAAKKHNTYVVMGANERAPGTLGTLFNSQFFFGPKEGLLGIHRKIMPTFFERMAHAPGNGEGLRTYPTKFGPIGGLICGEHSGSLARFALLAQQERIHIGSWPAFTENRLKETIDLRAKYHSFEGKVFTINAVGIIDDGMVEAMGLTPAQTAEWSSRGGGSSIIAPNGTYLAGPAGDEETILYAETNYDSVIEAKQLHDLTGHYNRYDIFTLNVTPVSQNLFGPGTPEGGSRTLPGDQRTSNVSDE